MVCMHLVDIDGVMSYTNMSLFLATFMA